VEYNGEKPNLGGRPKHTRGEGYGFKAQGEQAEANTKGRFPANLILDGSDEVVALFPNTKSSGGQFKKNDYEEKGVATNFRRGDFIGRNDSGSAARFFYCAKASKGERNAGCEGLEERSKVFNGQSDEPSKDMKGVEQKFTTLPANNNHPTVKPISLMRYLCRLVTPKGGIVLDPFLGVEQQESSNNGRVCSWE